MKITTLILSLLFFSLSAHASVSTKVNVESELEKRIKPILQSFDPYGQIVVNVEFRELTGSLPGMGIKVEKFTATQKVDFEDLKHIKIFIFSSLDPFPEEIKTIIVKALRFDSVPAEIYTNPIDPKMLELAKNVRRESIINESDLAVRKENNAIFNSLQQSVEGFFTNILVALLGGVILLIGGVFALYGFHFAKTKILYKDFLPNILSAIKIGSGGSEREAPRPVAQPPQQHANPTSVASLDSAQDKEAIQSLPIKSLVALFSDCYWCGEDGYANWLWLKLNQRQKSELLEKWGYASTYIPSITFDFPRARNDHAHPAYLNPPPIENISQDDLANCLREYPRVWHELTPLRQENITLSLGETIRCIESDKDSSKAPFQKEESKERVLSKRFVFKHLSPEDETYILTNPDNIPGELRSGIRSLAWLAAISHDARKEILAKVDARDLASAWDAPKGILEVLSGSLPEKKLQLLTDYLKESSPSKSSPVFEYLVDEALSHIKMNKETIQSGDFKESSINITDSAASDDDIDAA